MFANQNLQAILNSLLRAIYIPPTSHVTLRQKTTHCEATAVIIYYA